MKHEDDEYTKAFEIIFQMGFVAFFIFVIGLGLGLLLIYN